MPVITSYSYVIQRSYVFICFYPLSEWGLKQSRFKNLTFKNNGPEVLSKKTNLKKPSKFTR